MTNREQSLSLLHEWVSSDSLRKHCYAVAAAMEAYAEKYGEEKDAWWTAGLLHDFDYEKHPTLEQHPVEGVKILREKGYSEEIIQAILGHGNHTGVARESMMAKTLFAVDELCGLLVALAKVKPDRFESMTSTSVEKALKKKEFARAISREDIEQGIKDLGIAREEHFILIISALRKITKELGL